jgi:hypothetical protein
MKTVPFTNVGGIGFEPMTLPICRDALKSNYTGE